MKQSEAEILTKDTPTSYQNPDYKYLIESTAAGGEDTTCHGHVGGQHQSIVTWSNVRVQ